MKVGSRLRGTSSTAEVVVVRAGDGSAELECAGGPMTTGDAGDGAASEDMGTPVHLGKRYVDETSGVEVLCTKPGPGPLTIDGRELIIQAAAQLPASD